MALFTNKADQDLPLLTQVQQIQLWDKKNNVDNTELRNFILAWGSRNSTTVEMKNMTAAMINMSDERFDLLRETCLLSQRILYSLATQTVEGEPAFDVEHVRRFQDILKEIPAYAPSLLPAGGNEQEFNEQMLILAQPSGLIRARWLRYWSWQQGSAPRLLAASILRELGELFNYIWDQYYHPSTLHKKAVALCKECKNPYLVQRFGQEYCSHRCESRFNMRRRREEKNKIPNNFP